MKNVFPQKLEQPYIDLDNDVTDELCREFEEIERTGDYKSFFEKYLVFLEVRYPYSNGKPITIDDYFGVRDVLYLMFRLREAATKSKDVSDDELANLGISLERKADYLGREFIHPRIDFRVRGSMCARAYINKMDSEVGYLNIGTEIFERPFDEMPSIIYSIDNLFTSGQYMEFNQDRDSYITIEGDSVLYTLRTKNVYYTEQQQSNTFFAARILEALVDLHLREVETTNFVGVPYQRCLDGLTALWLAYCNKLANIRVTTCRACGKPIIVTKERGQRRYYCDDACRKWASRNPGKKRDMRVRN